jgi:hypothetical protein
MNAIVRRCAIGAVLAMLAMTLDAPVAPGQLPGVPVLQNAFANAGLAIAVNYGHAEDIEAYAGAIGWAPASARFQITGGAGVVAPDVGDRAAAWGARVSAPLVAMMEDRFGIGAFAGVGGASRKGESMLHVPAGASVSFRTRLGDRRGISFYATPFYSWTRVKVDEESESAGLVRASLGVDVTIVPSLGITVGYEFGQTADDVEPGATSGVFGVGVTYALRRGR